MIRAVIDTNVLVSGLISPAGNEALLILAVTQGRVEPCFSPAILEEYSAVLLRPKFGFSANEVECLLRVLHQNGVSFDPTVCPHVSDDPDDDKFIACALSSLAEFLVTGNERHFPQEYLVPTKVVNAAEFLQIVALEL